MSPSNPSNNDPYKAPSADVAALHQEELYQPRIFTTAGRIGRLRYLAYLMAGYLFLIPMLMASSALSAVLPGKDGGMGAVSLGLVILAYVLYLVFFVILMRRRFNDMNRSGWLAALGLIPVINVFIGLWLIFGRGTYSSNRYGPAPVANTTGVKIASLALPLIAVIGILAAISIPAYQDYVIRAQQFEAQSP